MLGYRTTVFRLSVFYLLLFAVISFLFWVYVSITSVRLLQDQIKISLEQEGYNLSKIYHYHGLLGLISEVKKRSYNPNALVYAVFNKQNKIVQSNIGILDIAGLREKFAISSPVFINYLQQNNETYHKMMLVSVHLDDKLDLLIGQDLSEVRKYIGIVGHALIVALFLMFIGAFFIWRIITRGFLKNIDNITKASNRIMAGDLTERLPISGSKDEFDRLANNLNTMLTTIERLNTGIQDISDNVAHDLKTPLTRLKNIAQSALMKTQLNEEDYLYNSLINIIAQVDQIIRTFDAILLVSRIETSEKTESLSLCNIKDVILEVVDFCSPVAQETAMNIKTGELFDCALRLNRELVAQAIFNIIDNSIKYGGGTIYVTMEYLQSSNKLAVNISDEGAGVDDAELSKISDRFYRSEKSRTQSGIGIGLSLVKATMKFHEGELLFKNTNPGFLVRLLFKKP